MARWDSEFPAFSNTWQLRRALSRSVPFVSASVFGCLLILLAFVSDAPSSEAPSEHQAEPFSAHPAPAGGIYQQQAEYVGSDLCQECHAGQWDSYVSSAHYALELSGDWPEGVEGCEACHGPGLTHAEMAGTEEPGFREAIVAFTRESARVQADQCLSCHAQQAGQEHFGSSLHLTAGVACAECHNSHQDLAVHAALRQAEPALCYSCHGDKRGEFSLTERHPVNEGLMSCSDCHMPHGSANLIQLAAVENDACTSCHLDKQGPWVFPHPPGEAETCGVCHQSHGSVNPHMLTHREMQFTCLQCHPSQPAFHVLPGFSECTACHAQIHGSNLDSFFLR